MSIPRRAVTKLARALALPLVCLGVTLPALGDDPPPPPPPWSGEAAASLVNTSGNSSSRSIGAGLAFVYDVTPWKMTFKSAYVRTEAEDVTQAEKAAALLRGEHALGDRAALFGQVTALRDTFAGLDGQETLEAGALFKLVNLEKHTLTVGASLGYTAEQRRAPDDNRSYASGRFGAGYKWAISQSAIFSEEVDSLYDLSDAANWHLTATTALTASVSRILALRVTHQLAYAHQPVLGRKSTDTILLASVVAKWPAKKSS